MLMGLGEPLSRKRKNGQQPCPGLKALNFVAVIEQPDRQPNNNAECIFWTEGKSNLSVQQHICASTGNV